MTRRDTLITASGLALAGASLAGEPGGAGAAAASGQLAARPRLVTDEALGPIGRTALGLTAGRDGVLHVPADLTADRPVPLVLLLHGAGGDAGQIAPLLADAADAHGLVLLMPDSRGRSWDLILDEYGPDVRFIDQALQHVFAHYPIDPTRIAVGGFSDGASYALSLGLINGDLFTHVLAFSPGFMAPTRVEDSPRFFVSHGVDDRVLPIGRTSRLLVPNLRRAGYAVDYREFADGHIVPPAIVGEAVGWFLSG